MRKTVRQMEIASPYLSKKMLILNKFIAWDSMNDIRKYHIDT
jgi:hypothetical protein